jgi:hypothetical protein
MNPINLKELAGNTYKLSHDPAAKQEPGGRKDPWLCIIPCRKGHIYPHSDKLLALWWESTTRLDLRCPALELYQDGDDEKTYLFRPEDFDRVAKMVGAKKRKQGRNLSESERQKAIERLRPHQFLQKSHSTQR